MYNNYSKIYINMFKIVYRSKNFPNKITNIYEYVYEYVDMFYLFLLKYPYISIISYPNLLYIVFYLCVGIKLVQEQLSAMCNKILTC